MEHARQNTFDFNFDICSKIQFILYSVSDQGFQRSGVVCRYRGKKIIGQLYSLLSDDSLVMFQFYTFHLYPVHWGWLFAYNVFSLK